MCIRDRPYTPLKWYWVIAGSTTQIFSSASLTFVKPDDITYNAWQETGGVPTQIKTAASLSDVLSSQVTSVLLANGVEIVSTRTPELNAVYPLDTVSQSQIASISTG